MGSTSLRGVVGRPAPSPPVRIAAAVAAAAVVALAGAAAGEPVAAADLDAGDARDLEEVGGPGTEQEPDPDVTAARTDGDDRIATAADLAERTFDARDETTTAVVARADDFPDALASASLAGVHDAPVLLTWHDRLPDRTREALAALAVDRVVLLGGVEAISDDVRAALAEERATERIAGANRWATAAEVAREVVAQAGLPDVEGRPTVLLASGEAFADALTAGPMAARGGHPILLTAADELPAATAAALDEVGAQRAVLVGGTVAVSDAVAREVAARGVEVQRIAGGDRTATAAAFADALVDRLGFTTDRVLLARGDDFPDALAAAPRAGALGAPTLLTVTPDVLGDPTDRWLTRRCPDVEVVEAVGGANAVGVRPLEASETAAESCAAAELTITYETGTRGEVHADPAVFRHRVAETLTDDRGWSLDGDIAFREVTDGGDLRIWLASPQAVDGAHDVCSSEWSCRVGDDVYVNDDNWREATATYRQAGRSLTEYRQYVVNHEVGHWLGHADYQYDCEHPDEPAPVMNQQSIALRGCATNVWPLSWERDHVRARWLE